MNKTLALMGRLLNLSDDERLKELGILDHRELIALDEYSKKTYSNLFSNNSYIRDSTIQEIEICKFLDKTKHRL